MRGANQPLSIDLALAAARSIDNPAYCIRYAHARMANVHAELAARGLVHDAANGAAAMRLLGTVAELRLMRRLGAFPDVVADCALRCAPHALLRYLRELAQDCHRNDAAQPGVVADAGLRDARLNLARATRIVLRNGLGLLGVAAPDHM
jgi:arginyl-tRNA synthetase